MAAIELGVDRDGDESQVTDELIGQACERMRPDGPTVRRKLRVLSRARAQIKECVNADVTGHRRIAELS